MSKCKICGKNNGTLYDGVCAGCLAASGIQEAQEAEAEEYGDGVYDSGSQAMSKNIQGLFKHRVYTPPNLDTMEGVAKAAGYDVRSVAWKRDGKELFNQVQLRLPHIKSGRIRIGTATAFLGATEPQGTRKVLVKQIGTACMWEYVED